MALMEGIELAVLKTELQNPHYAGLSHEAAAAEMNEMPSWNIGPPADSVPRDTIAAYEVFEAIVPADWAALSAAEKQRVQTILSMGMVNLRGVNTRANLAAAFAVGTATRTALQAMQNRSCSRAEFLAATLFVNGQAQTVNPWDVERARAS